MTYYLLNDLSGGPMEMLAFKGKVSRDEIQDEINRLNVYFDHNASDSGWLDGMYQTEYVLHHLADQYNFDILYWDNSDVLYY